MSLKTGDRRQSKTQAKIGKWPMTSLILLEMLGFSLTAAFENTMATAAATPPKQVSFDTVSKGNRSAVREPLEAVARNQADWKALWQKHVPTEPNSAALPAIDFSREIVIAVFLGEKPTGGHDIEITRMERSDDRLLVSFIERRPPPGSLVTQAFTQPFHIVKVAAQGSGTVSFRRLP